MFLVLFLVLVLMPPLLLSGQRQSQTWGQQWPEEGGGGLSSAADCYIPQRASYGLLWWVQEEQRHRKELKAFVHINPQVSKTGTRTQCWAKCWLWASRSISTASRSRRGREVRIVSESSRTFESGHEKCYAENKSDLETVKQRKYEVFLNFCRMGPVLGSCCSFSWHSSRL